ncbi:MAG: DsrE family protein [Nitrospirae bacterium]|nr:DsrE family protein [Nitrospirota bacterium]
MADTVLVLIKSNPLKSHRPAEAVRIALGLISGEHLVMVVLLNQAVLLLAGDTEDLVDGDILQKYIPVLKEMGHPFYVEENSLGTYSPDDAGYTIQSVSYDKITELIQQADRFLIF